MARVPVPVQLQVYVHTRALGLVSTGAPVPSLTPGRQSTPGSNTRGVPSTQHLQEGVTLLLDSSLTVSTRKAYEHCYTELTKFYKIYYGRDILLPLTVQECMLFVAYMHPKGYSCTTMSSYMSAVSYFHKVRSLPDNTASFVVHRMLTGARKLSPTMDTRLPVTLPLLHRLAEATNTVFTLHYESALYKAMFLLAFHAFMHISEMAVSPQAPGHALDFGDVQISSNITNVQSVQIIFRNFKHSTEPITLRIVPHPGPYCPVVHLLNYMQLRGSVPGYLFLSPTGRPVTKSAFADALRKCLQFNSLSPTSIKSHSFRIGAATR